MTKVKELERDIENLDKEIFRMEQLGMESDSYYACLQVERSARISELQFLLEHNL